MSGAGLAGEVESLKASQATLLAQLTGAIRQLSELERECSEWNLDLGAAAGMPRDGDGEGGRWGGPRGRPSQPRPSRRPHCQLGSGKGGSPPTHPPSPLPERKDMDPVPGPAEWRAVRPAAPLREGPRARLEEQGGPSIGGGPVEETAGAGCRSCDSGTRPSFWRCGRQRRRRGAHSRASPEPGLAPPCSQFTYAFAYLRCSASKLVNERPNSQSIRL